MDVDLEKEIGLLLREQSRKEADDLERELNLFRSGSAPPTVDGSLSAVGGLFGGGSGSGSGSGSGNGGGGAFSEFASRRNGHGFMSEEELRSDPAYLSYYYSNVNLNPRLPPPLLSKEDWRFSQRLKGGNSVVGGIGDGRKVNRNDNGSGSGSGRSLFSMPPGFDSRKQENEVEPEKGRGSAEWGGDCLIGLPGLGLGSKQKSLAEIFQDDLERTAVTGHLSRPASRNAFGENVEVIGSADAKLPHLSSELLASDNLQSVQGSFNGQTTGQPSSYTYAAALGASLSRSTTPDAQRTARAPSPCPTPIGQGRVTAEKRENNISNTFNGMPSNMNESTDLVDALSNMNLSTSGTINDENPLLSNIQEDDNHQQFLFGIQGGQNHASTYLKKSESTRLNTSSVPQAARSFSDLGKSNGNSGSKKYASAADRQAELQKYGFSNSHMNGSPTSTLDTAGGLHVQYQHLDKMNSNLGLSGYAVNPTYASLMGGQFGTSNLQPMLQNVAAASAIPVPGMDTRVAGNLGPGMGLTGLVSETQNIGQVGSPVAGNALQAPFVDPIYLQYLGMPEYTALGDPSIDRNYLGNSYLSLLELQKAYAGAVLSPQKSQYGVPSAGKSGASNHHGYLRNPAFGVGMSYSGSSLASPFNANSIGVPGSPIRHNDLNMHFSPGMRGYSGGILGPWHMDAGFSLADTMGSSLLQDFKSNKTKCFELSDIKNHVIEFSVDQYGSRFIQQKLEMASTEEKNMVYEEFMPQALSLMTDVFGNYVIQKFFEHGLPSQRRELASKLFGQVLTLSLQMYGCRVIQKAIEVADVDQKIIMVKELNGHVMRCVRDQNGNHVIQKCIECVPEENIQFIVSTFFDQVVTLSTHPYGCRVIQRILEHCKDSKTQSKVMDEILGAVSMLAQDQYGNYVVQHVLEHGNPHERSAIIKELAGKIVQMSQHKFASNVVEKCLTFGDASERELLVNEMLGTTDENEPLQAMMKDQFANYVVQKVLETCDDQQRELIMTRIKVHLNALKKYTYGKHIVARVEKLLAAGERRMLVQSLNA